MKKWWNYFKTEFLSRICSSKKRIIKFIAICLIPFLYGFICIWAFWNPIGNLGNAPMAVVNQSKPVTLVIDANSDQNNTKPVTNDIATTATEMANNKSSKLNLAVATYYVGLVGTGQDLSTYEWVGEPVSVKSLIDQNSLVDFDNYAAKYNNIAIYTHNQTYALDAKNQKLTKENRKDLKGAPIFYTQENKNSIKIIPNFSILRDYFQWWKNNPSPQNIIQYNSKNDKYEIILQSEREWNQEKQTYELIPEQELKNVQYLEGSSADAMAELVPSIDKTKPSEWKVINDKYWLQVQVPQDFNANAISVLNGYLTGTNESVEQSSYFINQMKLNPVNIWTTFKQNFLFGQFMKISTEFKAAILLNMVPNLVSQTVATAVTNVLNKDNSAHPSYYFDGTNNNIIINNQAQTLSDKQKYAVYDSQILNNIKSIQTNLDSFPTLNNVAKTLVGDTNSFTYDVSQLYLKATKNPFWKSIINATLNTVVVDGVYGKPVKLSNSQLQTLFGTSSGIQALFQLDSTMLGSLLSSEVVIPETSYSVTWQEFSNVFINSLKKKVGLIALINPNEPIVSKNSLNERLGKNISSWLGFLSGGASKIENLDGIVTNNIQGSQFAVYGIGLGEFFVCIGIWVGILMQTFVFDRNIRRPKKDEWKIGKHGKFDTKGNKLARYHDATAWWFAKNTLMSLTTIIQVTFLMITIGLLGWFQIGPSFGLVYVSILFTALIWTTFIQSLWFLFRDEVVGKFIVILFLIVNITSGWGTFPPVMQYKFFDIISNIAPFTYCIHNQGLIIYGIAVNGPNNLDIIEILKNCGIQLIFLFIGYLLSIYEGLNLQKITFFGSANAKKVADAIEMIGYSKMNPKLLITKTNKKGKVINKVNWNELNWTYNKEICDMTNSLYPAIVDFKKYKTKHECETYAIVE